MAQDPNQIPAPAPITAPVSDVQPVAAPQSIMAPTIPQEVYSAPNIKQVLTNSTSSLKSMKLNKLEKKIADANSTAELNQINIENTPVAMGVITGRQAIQNKLDTARINAVTGMYNAKLIDQQRKDTENQKFMETYGADPSKRPKGMSRKEFSAALGAGQFSNLLTTDYKVKQAQLKKLLEPDTASTGTWSATTDSDGNAVMLNNKTGEVKPMGSVNATTEKTPEMQALESQLLQTKGADQKVDPQKYLEMRNSFSKQASSDQDMQTINSAFDKNFSYLLSPEGAGYVQSKDGIVVTPQATGGSKAQQIAQSIMTPGSTLKLSGLSVKMQAAVQEELNKLKEQALASGDIYGIIKASAGGKDLDASTLQSFEKGVNVLSQIGELQDTIDKEATGPILGIIRSNNPYDTKAAQIKATLTAIVPNLARGIYGEVGVLTDNDVALYAKTLPTLSSTEDISDAVLGMTMRSVQRSLENKIKIQAGAGRNVSGLEGVYRGIEETATKIESKLPKPQENKSNISPEKQQYLKEIGLSNDKIDQKSTGLTNWFNSLFK